MCMRIHICLSGKKGRVWEGRYHMLIQTHPPYHTPHINNTTAGGRKLLEVSVVNGVGDGDEGGKLLNEGAWNERDVLRSSHICISTKPPFLSLLLPHLITT